MNERHKIKTQNLALNYEKRLKNYIIEVSNQKYNNINLKY